MVNKVRFGLMMIWLISHCFTNSALAATVDTLMTRSESMNKMIKAVIIKPDLYDENKKYPVIYLLHGHGGDYSDWIKKVPGIAAFADQYQLLIVCPDGNIGSWYFDSPIDSSWRYETYISKELVKFVDQHFKTISNKHGRAIMGLSMGGHGALYLCFKHQDIFGAAGSMSGGVNLEPFPNNWDIAKRLGNYTQFPERWNKNSVVNMTGLLKKNVPALLIDCGQDDFFYKSNIELHDKLASAKINHDFISRPGDHNWDYWSNAINYQMLFMQQFFAGQKL